MAPEKDYLGDKLRLVERARENAYFRKLDQELIDQMRQQAAPQQTPEGDSEGHQVEASVRQGPISDTIMDFIEETGIDLVVMSTHGRGGLQRFLVGSVTDRVIRSSRVPVLAIPLED